MLLTALPTLVCLTQTVSQREALVTAVYELRHVSPAYFLQELDDPKKPSRPQGIQSIVPDDRLSKITVKATPAAHTALKLILAQIDVEFKPTSIKKEPIFSEVKISTKVEGEVEVLEYATIAIAKDATAEIGIWTAEQLAGYLQSRRPFNYVMVSQDYFLRVIPHFSPDEKTARLEYFLLTKQKPKDSLIPLGTQTVTVGANTRMAFQSPPAFADKQEFFIRVKRANLNDF